MHTCDIPSCVNPEHLIEGTVKDNVQDYINKGRSTYIDNFNLINRVRRKIIRIDVNTGEEKIFKDVYEVITAGYHNGNVSECANGKRKHYRGFQWSTLISCQSAFEGGDLSCICVGE